MIRKKQESPRRARDDGRSLAAFLDEIDVACPRCGGHARIVMQTSGGGQPQQPAALPARLTCGGCGLSRTQRLAPGVTYRYALRSDGRDPFFGLPLWLATETRHGILFAWNARHLAALEDYVAADLRERHTLPSTMLRNRTLYSRLPLWMKRAAHREEILTGLRRLRQRLTPP